MTSKQEETDYVSVTEIAGDEVTKEQIDRLYCRYVWAAKYCMDKDVVEVACGTGQGLGYVANIAKTFAAGDYSDSILKIARQYYNDRISLQQFDAQELPFRNQSKDVIIFFEAIYYLPNAEKFVKECARVLRPNGRVLIATANKDLYDFNPSPKSYKYYGVVELFELFKKYNFSVKFFGDTPVEKVSFRQKMVRPIKKIIISLGLMPKSMAGKRLLKRFIFGNLVKMPPEIDASTAIFTEPVEISSSIPDMKHKVILCSATINGLVQN